MVGVMIAVAIVACALDGFTGMLPVTKSGRCLVLVDCSICQRALGRPSPGD
jgi:hypothetical protein